MLNSRDQKYLHPRLNKAWEELKERALSELGVKIILTSTGRDDEYQNELYQQGRTEPGSIVTYMKRTGAHGIRQCGEKEYCLAFDCVIVEYGNAVWQHPKYTALGLLGEEIGLFWGGRWTSLNDVYHFQLTDGLTASQLQSGQRPSWWHDDITGHWAQSQIEWAKDQGYLSGYPDGFFRPDQPLTRAQLAAVLKKVLG